MSLAMLDRKIVWILSKGSRIFAPQGFDKEKHKMKFTPHEKTLTCVADMYIRNRYSLLRFKVSLAVS